MVDDLVKSLKWSCRDPVTHEPIDDGDYSNATVSEVKQAIAEITHLRAAIERLAQWHDAHAAHYEDEERKFNALPDGMSIAANFAQAKFQHRQRASAIRAALEGKKDE